MEALNIDRFYFTVLFPTASGLQPTPMSNLEIKPCQFGIVFALGIESGSLEDLLSGTVRIRGSGFFIKEGGLKGRRVVIIRSGAGMTNAARAAEALIDGHHPKIIVSAGFAGGLDTGLKRHDILIADCVTDQSGRQIHIGRQSLPPDVSTKSHTLDVSTDLRTLFCPLDYKKIAWPGLHFGKLLSAGRVVRDPSEKQSLHEQHQAMAVDMETFAVAEVCRRRGTPLCAVRIIVDAASDALPPDIDKLLDQKTGAARLGAAIGAMWKRPSSIKDLWALKENSLVASMELAKFIAELAAMA